MKTLGLVLAAAAVLAFSGVAMAGKGGGLGKGAGKPAKPLMGTIKSVTMDANSTTAASIVVTPGHGKKDAAAVDVTIRTDDQTTVTIDGAAGKISDLKVGHHVKITPPDGKVTSIVATTASAGGKGGKRGK